MSPDINTLESKQKTSRNIAEYIKRHEEYSVSATTGKKVEPEKILPLLVRYQEQFQNDNEERIDWKNLTSEQARSFTLFVISQKMTYDNNMLEKSDEELSGLPLSDLKTIESKLSRLEKILNKDLKTRQRIYIKKMDARTAAEILEDGTGVCRSFSWAAYGIYESLKTIQKGHGLNDTYMLPVSQITAGANQLYTVSSDHEIAMHINMKDSRFQATATDLTLIADARDWTALHPESSDAYVTQFIINCGKIFGLKNPVQYAIEFAEEKWNTYRPNIQAAMSTYYMLADRRLTLNSLAVLAAVKNIQSGSSKTILEVDKMIQDAYNGQDISRLISILHMPLFVRNMYANESPVLRLAYARDILSRIFDAFSPFDMDKISHNNALREDFGEIAGFVLNSIMHIGNSSNLLDIVKEGYPVQELIATARHILSKIPEDESTRFLTNMLDDTAKKIGYDKP